MSAVIDIKEKINNQIDVDKEILSVLPKNNKKNLQAYKDKASEIKHEYENYLDKILSEMKRRTLKINSAKPSDKIDSIERQIKSMNKIELLDKNTTSFEKMELDEILYTLKRFYKNNLEEVNEAIVKCLDKFNMVGIVLTADDFNYSNYTKEYMEVFLEEKKHGDINSTKVKDSFEQIYWKCSDIIIHIELNFRYLYLKNEKTIDKYFEEQVKKITKDWGMNEEEAIEKYNDLQNELIETKNSDTALILNKFLEGEKNPKDYEESSTLKNYKKLVGRDPQEFSKEEREEIDKNIFRLQNSLYEYKNYLRFKFIYDEVLEIYNTKEKYNVLCSQKLKEIKKAENKLFKTNRKSDRYERHIGLLQKIFKRNNNRLEETTNDVNSQVLALRDLYRDYEENKVKNIIASSLNENSTIYDVLLLICKFYSFLVNTIIKNNPDISQEEIQESIKRFNRFIKYPRITIINNVTINTDKDIVLMIKDKYNLCNINITKSDLDEENVYNLITTVNILCENYNIVNNTDISIEDIEFILQANKILSDNNK